VRPAEHAAQLVQPLAAQVEAVVLPAARDHAGAAVRAYRRGRVRPSNAARQVDDGQRAGGGGAGRHQQGHGQHGAEGEPPQRPHGSGSPHGDGPFGSRPAFSNRLARCHGLSDGPEGSGAGAVSRRNCSIAAAIAAACSGDAAAWRISMRGRGGVWRPFLDTAGRVSSRPMPELAVFSHDAVLAAVSPLEAIERVRDGFVRHASGEWQMPAKVYLEAPPGGDFRAMPARGSGLAILKWVSSFPGNPTRGLPVVNGVICVSRDDDAQPVALIDTRSVTALRTGAVAAIAAQELARPDAATAGLIGCGLHGAWAARCLAAAEYGPGVCFDPDPDRAGALAGELGWEAGTREDALGCDVVTCVTPGHDPVVHRADLRPGLHLSMLGADGPGKAEAEPDAVAACTLFCDEWEQASHGGELTPAIEAGLVEQVDVTELGEVLTGMAPGRPGHDAVTLFDSTGLAIQDLAICHAVLEAHRAGVVKAASVRL
jgi:alanine dehydrogenase